jgi:hypothetical protein
MSREEERELAAQGRRRATANVKGFFGRAILTWLLYYVGFYVIGLVMNLVFLARTRRIKRDTGRSPSGRGCLQLLLLTHFWIPAIVVLLTVATGGVLLEYLLDAVGVGPGFFDSLLEAVGLGTGLLQERFGF